MITPPKSGSAALVAQIVILAPFLPQVSEIPVPEELKDEAASRRQALIEAVSEVDDTLAEAFLAEQPIDADMLKAAIRR